jgi:hypothetical protein
MKRIVVASVCLVLLSVPAPVEAITLFSDGFESGTLSAWSASGGLTVETSDPRSGTWAAGNNGTSNAWVREQLSADESDLYARVFVKVYSSSTNFRVLRFATSGGAGIVRVFLNGARRLSIRNDVTGASITSTTVVSTGVWHEIELHAVAGTGGSAEVWFDGTSVSALSGPQNLGSASFRRVELANPAAGAVFDAEFDDVAIAQERIGGGQTGTPSITSFTPLSGPAGTIVTIAGTGFAGANAVTFDGMPSIFEVVSDASISATVPTGASTGPIRVTTPGGSADGPTDFTVTGAAETFQVVVAGDICGNSSTALTKCGQTGDRVVAVDPAWVIAVGDLAYPRGTASDFSTRYHPRWGGGNTPSFLGITRPVPGNHEFDDPVNGNGAEGYRAYFPDTVAPGSGPLYYSWNEGDWHFVGLETDQCTTGERCSGIGSGSAQIAFLQADLSADPHTCEIAYGHHPRWSSPSGAGATNRHGSQAHMQPAWQIMVDQGVDLYLAGHDHDYERFTQMNATGAADPMGTRQFVVGTGGAGLYAFGPTILPTSQAHFLDHGILILTLAPSSYSWTFTDEFGAVLDTGGPVPCH